MSFWRTYYHIVWATKYRAFIIDEALELQIYPYIVKRAGEMGVYIYAINGWFDHVHVLSSIPPKIAIADVVKQLKGASAHFANHELHCGGAFGWQRGYGVLTCGERQRSFVEEYIHNQKQHHADSTANRWLEYVAENDDGPQPPEPAESTSPTLRESPMDYDKSPI